MDQTRSFPPQRSRKDTIQCHGRHQYRACDCRSWKNEEGQSDFSTRTETVFIKYEVVDPDYVFDIKALRADEYERWCAKQALAEEEPVEADEPEGSEQTEG